MAHFAEIRSSDNAVLRVVVINDSDIAANGGEYSSESETWVANNIPNDSTLDLELYRERYWKQTSYNTRNNQHYTKDENGLPVLSEDQTKAKRFRYAAQFGTYDPAEDIFIDPKPFASWTLDANNRWQPPVAMPPDFVSTVNSQTNNQPYRLHPSWDEENQRWYVEDVEVDNTTTITRIWNPETSSWEN